jgi:hypothetical protein
MQPRQHHGVASIRFYAVAGCTWDTAWSDNVAVMPGGNDLAINVVSAGAGFVAREKVRSLPAELTEQLANRFRCVGDGAVSTLLPKPLFFGNGNGDVSLWTSSPTNKVFGMQSSPD